MLQHIDNPSTKVIILGTGNPNPNPEHSGCAVLILVDEKPYVVDFGANVVRQIAALTPEYGGSLHELQIETLSTAFCTHLHSDHTLGLPDLILTPWIMGRTEPLALFGPKGIKKMAENILGAYETDIRYRIHGHEPISGTGWKVDVHEINEGIIFQDEHIIVEAFPVAHGDIETYGFRFTTPDKTVVISGDTSPCDNIISFSKDADILIHEVYSQKGFETLPPEWKKYHAAHHASTKQLADIANRCKPKLLVTYHMLFWKTTSKDILNEIQQSYSGKVVVAHDLQIFS
ncbi:MAG: MBL fold metallo-hydrolase [Candidatus Cloacimonetes bacterium]|nr:MBL fold metallo-hydrolase [Candidatus Cloacimonadota bacterium]